ncbi:MAG: hypothetical protein ABIO38_03470 [Luteimonas sp.]
MQPNLFRNLACTTLAAALISLGVYAQRSEDQNADVLERSSPDILPAPAQRRLSLTAKAASVRGNALAPTLEDVGDVDSFGRNVKWLGVANAFVFLEPTCDDPEADCQVLAPSPAVTSFNFMDTASIKLPKKSAHSLLCYWFSPALTINYHNQTATRAIARLRYTPTLTVENDVLDDPALIDPTTGLPFGGSLLTSMTSSERLDTPLEAGVQYSQRTRDSAVCIAGFLTRRALVETYGLTEAKANEFFNKETTVRLNIQNGSAQHISFASLVFGLRIVGD